MKDIVFVHSDFAHLSKDILQIPHLFEESEHILHEGRNQIRVIDMYGYRLVVKRFRRITLANRFIYRFFRKSKAHRAFINAEELLKRGVSTPAPVAYIDENGRYLLGNSFFISEYIDYNNFGVNKSKLTDREFIIAFANFLYSLHQQGVFHNDLNIGNVMYKQKADGDYDFCLVDNNRMQFRKATYRRIKKNFNRLFLSFESYSILVHEYALVAGFEPYAFMENLLWFRKTKVMIQRFKTSLKRIIEPGL